MIRRGTVGFPRSFPSDRDACKSGSAVEERRWWFIHQWAAGRTLTLGAWAKDGNDRVAPARSPLRTVEANVR